MRVLVPSVQRPVVGREKEDDHSSLEVDLCGSVSNEECGAHDAGSLRNCVGVSIGSGSVDGQCAGGSNDEIGSSHALAGACNQISVSVVVQTADTAIDLGAISAPGGVGEVVVTRSAASASGEVWRR